MDKKLTSLLILLVLIFSLFIGYVVFQKPIATFTKAKEESIPSSTNSLIFAWPLSAKIDKKEKIQINVFIRNANNIPLSNKLVSLKTNLGTINPSSSVTDKNGKATFILESAVQGIAEITAIVDNKIQLSKTISVKFE